MWGNKKYCQGPADRRWGGVYKPVRLDARDRVVRLGAQGKAEQWLGGAERLGGSERQLGGSERRLGGSERLGGAELCGAAEILGVPLTLIM